MFPCKELHKIWKQWLNAYRWIYNWTIATLNSGCKSSAYDLQKQCREWDKPDWVNQLPGHQLQEAVADAWDAYKPIPLLLSMKTKAGVGWVEGRNPTLSTLCWVSLCPCGQAMRFLNARWRSLPEGLRAIRSTQHTIFLNTKRIGL